MKAERNPSTSGIFFGGLAYVIEYRNFRASDAWYSGDFYMGERRADVRVEQKNPDSNGMRAVGKDLGFMVYIVR